MSDNDLVKRLRENWITDKEALEVADRIESLTAQLESTLRDRKFILEERDRTFALMLARAEKAESESARLREDLEELDFLRHEGGPDSVAAMEAELKLLRAVLSDIKTASVCSVSRHVAASALGEAAA